MPLEKDEKVNIAEEDESESINFKDGYTSFIQFLKDFIDLKKGVDPSETAKEIRAKQSMSGANAWMLMCSIMIASLGLSMNSQAVIIGAMLISPLMSPMLGIGLGVGINDMRTLRSSLGHFGIAIFIAIVTSTIYFSLSPVDTVTTEILARTRPTLLDIFVAVFGGTAGIISIARKDISTTIPGVAIATALMPPLCVTGFGIAHGAYASIALPSFYLFFLNSFFVILATYLVIRFLKFPYKKYLKKKVMRINAIYSSLFSLAIIIPSFFIFRGVMKEHRIQMSLERFENECLGENQLYLDSYQLSESDKVLYLKVYGDVINEGNKYEYQTCLSNSGLENVEIQIIPTSDVDLNRVKVIERGMRKINLQLQAVESSKSEAEDFVRDFQNQLVDTTRFLQIQEEVRILFPEIENIGLAKAHFSDFVQKDIAQPTLLVKWKTNQEEKKLKDLPRLIEFVGKRMAVDTLRYIEW